jgi:hypothetical protein
MRGAFSCHPERSAVGAQSKDRFMLPILLAASFAIGPLSWQLPEHWESLPPPAEAGIDYIFLPLPQYRDGQNIAVMRRPFKPGASLSEYAGAVARDEEQDGRTIVRMTKHSTCGAKLPAIEVETKFGFMVSQLYHFTTYGDRVYTFIYTYGPTAEVDSRVRRAIDSICVSTASRDRRALRA